MPENPQQLGNETLEWRLEHAVSPPAMAPLLAEVIQTLRYIREHVNEPLLVLDALNQGVKEKA